LHQNDTATDLTFVQALPITTEEETRRPILDSDARDNSSRAESNSISISAATRRRSSIEKVKDVIIAVGTKFSRNANNRRKSNAMLALDQTEFGDDPIVPVADNSSDAARGNEFLAGTLTSRTTKSGKNDILIREEPLRNCEEVLDSDEATQKVTSAILNHPMGTLNRWEKLLAEINVVIEPAEDEPDPLRIELSLVELRRVLSSVYQEANISRSDTFSQMRQYMPIIYEGHDPSHAKKLSQRERNKLGLSDECYAYGEVDYETFATIFIKIQTAYGICYGDFYDLGCGVGSLVYTAAFLGSFSRCIGIEKLNDLLDRGRKRSTRWNRIKPSLSSLSAREVQFEWIHADFLEKEEAEGVNSGTSWTKNASFIFLHWTAFSKRQMKKATDLLMECKVGTICITLTTPISTAVPSFNNDSNSSSNGNIGSCSDNITRSASSSRSTGYEVLESGDCETSWGSATYYVHEKMS
jgi:hypothetical protein